MAIEKDWRNAAKAIVLNAYGGPEVFELKDLVEAEKLRPVIDRTHPLSETPEAFRYLKEEHARGKVVIIM